MKRTLFAIFFTLFLISTLYLPNSFAQDSTTILIVPTGAVRSVAFSPDGQTLASGGSDNIIRLWDVHTGEPIHTLTGHTGWVNSVSFSPDGQTLASGSWDETIGLWNVHTGEPIRILTGHTNFVHSVSFSPDGQTLASGAGDTTIGLWNVHTGEPIRILTGRTDPVRSVSFSPDGQTLASGGNDIGLWDVHTGEPIRALTGHQFDVNNVTFSLDGQKLASGSGDGTVILWDMGLLAADVTGDSVVNIQDLVLVAGAFGKTDENETDVNGDGVVNIQDLVLVAGAFGNRLTLPSPETVRQHRQQLIEVDTKPPIITGGTVVDGEKDVDPGKINGDGKLEVIFSEEVTGNIALQTEGGSDAGWLGAVDGTKGTLELVKGKEISYETTYVIAGEISDAAGNTTDIQIVFVTGSLLDNLVAHWSFERDGDWDFDWYDGRIIGQPKFITGVFGDALNFDGENDAVVFPDDAAFGGENITLMGWFTPNDAVTNRPLIVKNGAFYVGFDNNNQLKCVVQPNDTFVKSISRLRVGNWYHFAVTYDGKTMKVYIDGELENEQPNDIPIAQSEADLVIGEGFAGGIDEVGFYNKALTEDEIVILMEEGFLW